MVIFYVFLLTGVAVLLLAAFAEAALVISRRPSWSLTLQQPASEPRPRAMAIANSLAKVPEVASAPVNETEWHLTA